MDLKALLDYYSYPWLTMLLAGVVAMVVALVAQGLIFAALRRVTRVSTIASAIVEFTAAPSRLMIPLLALQFVIAAAPADLYLRAPVQHVLAVLLIAAVTWAVIRIVAGTGEAVVRLHPASTTDNLHARRIQTQTRVLTRTVEFFLFVLGIAAALMTFPGLRQIGASLLASAGVAGLVAGIAARPVFGNLMPRVRAEVQEQERSEPSRSPALPPIRAGKGDSTAIKTPTHAEVEMAHDSRAPAEAQDSRKAEKFQGS